jgi:hypothetical protein
MNEFLFMAAFVITAFLCAGTWCAVRELFNRWVNNDWCKHDWGMWEALDKGIQHRFCKKCNKAEKRYP